MTEEKLKRLEYLESLINSPEVNDFIEGLKIEQAHQTEKWGREQEENHHPAHYILVNNKLLGKLTVAMWDGDVEKFKHHCITIAAAMFNCHRQIMKKGTHINDYFFQNQKMKMMKVHSASGRDKNLKNVPDFVPMGLLNEEQAQHNHSQSLDRLNERGGLGVLEILDNIHKRKLTHRAYETQEEVDELNKLISEFKP